MQEDDDTMNMSAFNFGIMTKEQKQGAMMHLDSRSPSPPTAHDATRVIDQSNKLLTMDISQAH